LPPGSPEAEEADKKRDSERKRAVREKAALVAEPPALPSMATPGPGPGPASPGAGSTPAPGEAVALDPAIPWDPATLKPIFEELIEGAEQSRVEKLRNMAIQGGLSDKLVQEIARDSRYSPVAKRTMALTAPNVTAKALNRIGVSGKYSDEAILLTALIGNFVQGRRLQSKLQKLIEQTAAKKAEDPKKP
jgi:hypothetical protein